MRSYSMDLRKRILLDVDEGLGTQAIAEKYRVSNRFIQNLKRRRAETGEIAARPRGGGRRPKLADHLERLQQLAEEHPDATLNELREKLGVEVSITTIWKTLKRLGFTFKKSSSCR